MVVFADELPAEERTRFVGAVRPATLDRAHRAFGLAWFSMAEHMHMSVELHRVIGPQRFRRLMRDTFRRALDTPMLHGMFGMMRRVSDDPVETLLRNAARLYGYVTRDVGSLQHVALGTGQGRIDLEGWPAEFDFEVWAIGVARCIEGAILGLGATGTVELLRMDARTGAAGFAVRW
jgi:hypothetical protein